MRPPHIDAFWKPDHQETLGEFIDHLQKLILALQKIHPIFASLYEMGRRTPAPIAADLTGLIQILRKRSFDKRDEYSKIGEDGLPTLNSTRSIGYRCSLSSNPKHDEMACATKVDLSISSGTIFTGFGSVQIDFPPEGAPEFYELDFQKKLMQIIVEIYQPPIVYLRQMELEDKFRKDEHDMTLPFAGTVVYYSDKRIADVLPEDIEREGFCDGVLIIISRDQPDPDNAKQILDIQRVQKAIKQSGLTAFVQADSDTLVDTVAQNRALAEHK